ncbi:hypothetical protein HXX76_012905 [Chlamydomonas incerta]|uniref:Uncharacterized protein n=2 Tax=Chlamydomonas incerta TaxID=51695 RepID=A0A835SQV1_CHLIN|nr:hypothetical protein HXX76_012905 [Chlamydomonas incerta]|eukprot:KAG2426589.1 hypothetical protein HXX76_012905 [Chlamydomonas incerta]
MPPHGGPCCCYPEGHLARLPPELLSRVVITPARGGDGCDGVRIAAGGEGPAAAVAAVAVTACGCEDGDDGGSVRGAPRLPAGAPGGCCWCSPGGGGGWGCYSPGGGCWCSPGGGGGGGGGVFDRLSGGDLARCRAVHSSWRAWLDGGGGGGYKEEEEGEGEEQQLLHAAALAKDATPNSSTSGGNTMRAVPGGGSSSSSSSSGCRQLLWRRAAAADGLTRRCAALLEAAALTTSPPPLQPLLLQPPPLRLGAPAGGSSGSAAAAAGDDPGAAAAASNDGGAAAAIGAGPPPAAGSSQQQEAAAGGMPSSPGGSGGGGEGGGGADPAPAVAAAAVAAVAAAGHVAYRHCLAVAAARRADQLAATAGLLPDTLADVARLCLPAEELVGQDVGGQGGGGGSPRPMTSLARTVSRLAELLESGRVRLLPLLPLPEGGGGGGGGGGFDGVTRVQWQAADGASDGCTVAQMCSLCHTLNDYRLSAMQHLSMGGIALTSLALTPGVAACGPAGRARLSACEARSKSTEALASKSLDTLRMALASLDLKVAVKAAWGGGDDGGGGAGGTATEARAAGSLRRAMEGVRPALRAAREAAGEVAAAARQELEALKELAAKLSGL